MVQQMLRLKLWDEPDGKSLMHTAREQAYKILRRATPEASKYQEPVLGLDHSLRILRLVQHISHFGSIATNYNPGPDRELASLIYDAGFWIWRRQIDLEEGIQLFNQALKFLPNNNPGDVQDDLLRSHIYLVAGRTYHSMGPNHRTKPAKLFSLARSLRQRIYERLGPYNRSLSHKIWLFCARADAATAQLDGGAVDVAYSLFEDCLKDYNTWCADQEMPYDIAKMHHGLAACHLARGDPDSTMRCLQSGRAAVERSRPTTGGDSVYHYCHLFPHACMLEQLGKRDEALALHERVLDAHVKHYGEEGLPTLQSRRAIAALRDGV